MNNIVKTIEHNGLMSGHRTIEIHQCGNCTYRVRIIPDNGDAYWINYIFRSAKEAEQYLQDSI